MYDWTEADEYLGTDYDPVIAKRFNMTVGAVARRRRKLGIPAKRVVTQPNWDEVDPDLGTDTDTAVATKHCCSAKQIANRRNKLGIPAFKAPVKNPKASARWKRQYKARKAAREWPQELAEYMLKWGRASG